MYSTWVTFPSGGLTARVTVLSVHDVLGGVGVVTDRTPFHPESLSWPDQPGDRGALWFGSSEVPVLDTRTAVWLDGTLRHDRDALRLPGAVPLVLHVVGGGVRPEGSEVSAVVDPTWRAAHSRAHDGAHLMSLALNAAVAGAWRKAPPPDSRGRPDFDRLAIMSARLSPDRSVDQYRLGRSLRKSGFDDSFLRADLTSVEAVVNAELARWIEAAGRVQVESDGPLSARRTWIWDSPDGPIRMGCGGTHVASLRRLRAVTVRLALPDPETLEVVTTTVPEECFTN